jgi:hypothetical protein
MGRVTALLLGLALALGMAGCTDGDGDVAPDSAYELGPSLPGARAELAQLPYPDGAGRLQAGQNRVVYAVPAEGDDPVAELEAFYEAALPAQGWTVTGRGARQRRGGRRAEPGPVGRRGVRPHRQHPDGARRGRGPGAHHRGLGRPQS